MAGLRRHPRPAAACRADAGGGAAGGGRHPLAEGADDGARAAPPRCSPCATSTSCCASARCWRRMPPSSPRRRPMPASPPAWSPSPCVPSFARGMVLRAGGRSGAAGRAAGAGAGGAGPGRDGCRHRLRRARRGAGDELRGLRRAGAAALRADLRHPGRDHQSRPDRGDLPARARSACGSRSRWRRWRCWRWRWPRMPASRWTTRRPIWN